MVLLHRFRRRRWLVVAGAVAVATQVIFLVTGVTASGQAPTVSSARPVVDRDYIYRQLFDMSYNDVYRASGADGDPRNPNDAFNLPPTVNGWQEFFARRTGYTRRNLLYAAGVLERTPAPGPLVAPRRGLVIGLRRFAADFGRAKASVQRGDIAAGA